MNRKDKEKQQARIFRKEKGWSLNQIAKQLGVSKSSVSYWVKDIKLSDEQICKLRGRQFLNAYAGSKANKEKWENIRKGWQLDGRKQAQKGEKTHLIGCMIYWGEGRKNKNVCSVGNTDVEILKTFVYFLRKYFNISDSEIRLQIQCYLNNGVTQQDIIDYWLSALNLKYDNIRRFSINGKRKTSGKRKNIHLYGICDVSLLRTDIVQHIFGAIQEYIGINKEEWLW